MLLGGLVLYLNVFLLALTSEDIVMKEHTYMS
jgi:hypothetical protein